MTAKMEARDGLRIAARCLENNLAVATDVLACEDMDEEHIENARTLARLSDACFSAAVAEYLRQVSR